MVDLIFVGLAEILSVAMEAFIDQILTVFGFNFNTFASAFPYAADAYVIFQRTAVGFVLLIGIAQLIIFFFGNSEKPSSPLKIATHSILAVGAIYYGNYILSAIMEIAQMPYDALLQADIAVEIDFSAITLVINDAFYMISPLLYIVILLLVGIAFIKLLLEAVERYVVLFVLIYVSPLAASTLATETTSGVYKRYFTMFISQCILMILNVWSLQMTVSLFRALPSAEFPMLSLLIGYAFLRIASRLDSYLNSLGLNAAVTGAGLGVELLASGMALFSRFSPSANGNKTFSQNAAGGSGSGNILGDAAAAISNFTGKYSPVAAGSVAAKNGIGAFAQTFGESFNAGKDAATNASGLFGKASAGFNAAKDTFNKQLDPNLDIAAYKNENESIWWRGFGNHTPKNYNDFSEEDLHTIASTPYMADAAFNGIQDETEIDDSATVSAMADGIGVETLGVDAQEAINVGNGTLPAENVDYAATADGIHMGYEKDGKIHDWSIKNATQYSRLSPEEQKLYAPFKSGDGHQYYARHDLSRAPTETQKKQTAATAEMSQFAANPVGTNLSSDTIGYMRKNPDQVAGIYQSMKKNGTAVTAETPDGRRAISQLLTAMPTPERNTAEGRAAAQGRQLAIDQLNSGNPVSAVADGDGIRMSWVDQNGENHSFDMVMPQNAVNMSSKEGYASFGMGNEAGWIKYQAPLTQQERIQENLTSSAASPVAIPLTRETMDSMAKNPDMTSKYMTSFAPDAEVTAPDQVSGVMQGIRIDGKRHSEASRLQAEAIRNLENGTAASGWVNENSIGAAWTDETGSHEFVALTQKGADLVDGDPRKLGFDRIHSGGETYYVPSTPVARETEILSKTANFGTNHGPTSADYGYIQNLSAAKKNEFINKTFDGLQKSGETVKLNEENRRELADFIALGSWENISKEQRSRLSTSIAADDISTMDVAVTERGYYVDTDNGTMTVLTSQVVSRNGNEYDGKGKPLYDPEYLSDRGYRRNNINGREYWSKFEPKKENHTILEQL